MEFEMTYETVRRWYFIATDAINVISIMWDRELRSVYEGNPTVMFIDCYDLISLLFQPGELINDEHHEWNKTLWSETLSDLNEHDCAKVAISPPSSIELFHFLERKANFVYKEVPTIEKEDLKDWNSFWTKLVPCQHAFSLTRKLLDPATEKVPQLRNLKVLMDKGKIVEAGSVFDYSVPQWERLFSEVSPRFDAAGAEVYLVNQRKKFLKGKQKQFAADWHNIGLDSFSVSVDISNIAQTIFLNSTTQEREFTFTSHGVYLTLCCHPQTGFWKDKSQAPPVLNSMLALFLAKALRHFKSLEGAIEFYLGTKFALKNYLRELVLSFNINTGLEDYIRHPQQHKGVASRRLKTSPEFLRAQHYVLDYCIMCLPGLSQLGDGSVDPMKVGPTGVQSSRKELLDFARDKRLRQEKGEQMLNAARRSIADLDLLNPERIARSYYPHNETASELLLKLSGYGFADWERK